MIRSATLVWARPLAAQNRGFLVYLFFFISGVPSLIYQLLWQRVLFRIFGLSMDSVTVIVTAFMLGLGFGSLAGGWLSRRKLLPPLAAAAVIELAIGLFGFFSISILGTVDPLVQNLTLAERAFAIIALVFVPTALMGATLPLLIGHLVETSTNVGVSAGSLYRINALGAVAGCVVSALLLFPFLGLRASATVAAALNLLVATIAATAHFTQEAGKTRKIATSRPRSTDPATPLSFSTSAVFVLASGFISLSFEIFFLHLASFASGSNSVSFTITLAAFILGIASGANDAALWCGRGETRLSPQICRLLLVNGLAGLAVLPLLAISGPLGNGLIAIISIAAFAVARSLGAVFPLVAHLSVPADDAAGYRAGLLYMANIVGAAAGSMLTGFVLCDLAGIRVQALLLSGAGLLLAIALIVMLGGTGTRRMMALLAGIAALLGLTQMPLTRPVVEAMQYKQEMGKHPAFTRVVENRYGIVTVSPDGTVSGGGVYDGRFNTDLVHDSNGVLRAYALSLFHPAPRDVLMIGLASGSWAQAVAGNPQVRHLTVLEINPGYLPLLREHRQVSSLLSDPKVTIVIDDANRWLKRHAHERYDAVVANATYNFRTNASNLLSEEFDRMIAGHLKPGGIYLFNATDSPRVEIAACDTFQHGFRLFNSMVVSNAPLQPDRDRWRDNLLATRIDGHPVFDLRRQADKDTLIHDLSIPAYADRILADPSKQPLEPCHSLKARYAGTVPVTDDNMGTEWRHPLGLD